MIKKTKKILALFFFLAFAGVTAFFFFHQKDEKEGPFVSKTKIAEERNIPFLENEILINYNSQAPTIKKVQKNLTGNESFLEAKELLSKEIEKEIREKIKDDEASVTIDFLLRDKTKALAIKPGGMILLTIKSGTRTASHLEQIFYNDDDVLHYDPNYIFTTQAENAEDLWHIYNNSFDAGVNADLVWESGYTGEGVKVAVVDSGIWRQHTDLIDNIWKNPGETSCDDGIDNDDNGYIDDCYGWNFGGGVISGSCNDYSSLVLDQEENNITNEGGSHGTHVAGTIGAVRNDNGVVGVAPQATLMPVKVFPGTELCTPTIYIIKGLYYAIENEADVINVSAGIGVDCSKIDLAIQAAAAAKDAGIPIVAASGNGHAVGSDAGTPASCEGVVGVGATDETKTITNFSSRMGDLVDVVAPGFNVLSTIPGNAYQAMPGTSMATPHVTGIVALMFQKNPNLSVDEINTLLCENAEDLGEVGRDETYGCGFADANVLINNIEAATEPEEEAEAPNTPPDISLPPEVGKSEEEEPTEELPNEENPMETPENPETPNEEVPAEENPTEEETPIEEDPEEENPTSTKTGFYIDIDRQITYPGCPIQSINIVGGNTKEYEFVFDATENMGVEANCTASSCSFTKPISTGQATLFVREGSKTASSVIFSQPNPVEDSFYETSLCLRSCKNDSECKKTCMPSPSNCPDTQNQNQETPVVEEPEEEPIAEEIPEETEEDNNNVSEPDAPEDIPTENEDGTTPQDPEEIPNLGDNDEVTEVIDGPSAPPQIPVDAETLAYWSCTENIADSLAKNTGWEDVQFLHGTSQNTWQRAVLSYPQGFLQIGSQEKSQIKGSALPNARVQIFFFSLQKDEEGNILPPAQGTCVETLSDVNGYFSLAADDKLFWENIGESIVFDAFYLDDEMWDNLPETRKYAPAAFAPQIIQVTGIAPEKACENVCENGVIKAVEIDTSMFPNVLIRQNNLEEHSGKTFTLSRGPGKTSFSLLFDENTSEINKKEQEVIFQKTLIAENLKRMLLDYKETETESAMVSRLSTVNNIENLNDFSAQNLELLHNIITTEKNERIENINALLKNWKKTEKNTAFFEIPVGQLLHEMLPKNAQEQTWKNELYEALSLWSGGTAKNMCFLPEEDLDEYFRSEILENPCY
jgi:subtilisin family serine protease